MSIEELKADLKRNLTALPTANASSGDLANHLRLTLWPFLENVVTELEAQDDAICEVQEGEGEFLSPETGNLLTAALAMATQMLAVIADKQLLPANELDQIRVTIREAAEALKEIVVEDLDDDESDDDDAEAE